MGDHITGRKLEPVVIALHETLHIAVPEIRALASRLIRVMAIVLPLDTFAHGSYFTMRSGGKTAITFLFDSAYVWLCCIPLAFCLSRFTGLPIVLLVNGGSASASEILTGALRERADATVVGVNTYGKGIVQVVLPSGKDGAGFQMTVAQYLTPAGTAVHKIGIAPDVEVKLEEGDNGSYDFADVENDPQLKKALEVMTEKLAKPE